MNRTFAAIAICIGLAIPSLAQAPQIENPRLDIFGGYSHVGNYNIGMNGWTASATWNLYRWIGIEGDVSGGYGSQSLGQVSQILPNVPKSINSRMHNFNFGPSGTWHPSDNDKYDAFGHLLFGFSHTNVNAEGLGEGSTSFSWVLGGGADYDLTPEWAARAQLDWLHTHFFDAGQNHGRIALGIVYRFNSGGTGR